jgi:ribosomal subunit interface protein
MIKIRKALMTLSVTGKGMDVGDALKTHVQESLESMGQQYLRLDGDAKIGVEGAITFTKQRHLFIVEVGLHAAKGVFLHASDEADEPYVAFDRAKAHLERRLKKYNGRMKDHNWRNRHMKEEAYAQQYVLNSDEEHKLEEDHLAPVIVAEMTTAIPSLSVKEAVMRMDLGNTPTIMFKNDAHGRLNVVYRRADGNFGWIDPKDD